mmetsp:Transcript_52541/g.118331  ORF Transcript_52541/g.118331 Transcript_52541/m.118331 type:complete len:228 (-) Transcript_52541:1803-2486(-)
MNLLQHRRAHHLGLEKWRQRVAKATSRRGRVTLVQPELQLCIELWALNTSVLFKCTLHKTLHTLSAASHVLHHAKTKLSVVLEQGVCPCWALASLVRRVGRRAIRKPPDGRTTGGIRNDHASAEELCHELHIGRLPTSCAGPMELQQGLLELRTLHRSLANKILPGLEVHKVVPIFDMTMLRHLCRGDHLEGIIWADLDTYFTACAVLRTHLDPVIVPCEVPTGGFS